MPQKNVAAKIPFHMTSATTGSDLTGLSPAGYRSLDGGAEASVGGTITEIGHGDYLLSATTADMNANCIRFYFTGTGAITDKVTIFTNGYDQTVANLPANTTQLAGQTVTAASGVTFSSTVGTSTLTQAQVTGGAYALHTDGSGNVKALDTSGNALATAAAVANITNNTFVSTNIPMILEVPTSGNYTIPIRVTFNDETGSPINLDSGNPAITLTDDAGTDRSGRLGSWTNPATGEYQVSYTNTSTDTLEGLQWNVTGTVNSKLRRVTQSTQLVSTIAVDFTGADRTVLDGLATTLGTPAGASVSADIAAVKAEEDAIKAKTDLIATNAADSPNAVTAQGTIGTNLDAHVSAVPTAVLAATVDGVAVSKILEVTKAILGGVSVAHRVQVLTINGSPTGGTFTIGYNGATTSALAYNASAATVQAALVALATVGAGNATVSGSNGGPYTITLGGSLALATLYQFNTTPSLSGGTSPTITQTTQIEFKKADGTTTDCTITFNGFDGIRTASTIV